MKNLSTTIVLAALLLAGAAPVRAAARPTEDRRYAYADQSLDAVAKKISDLKACISRLAAAKADLESKKSEIAAKNGGVVPAAYDDVIALRLARVTKFRDACFTINKDIPDMIASAHVSIRGIEPPSSAGVPKRRERLNSLQALANSVAKNLR